MTSLPTAYFHTPQSSPSLTVRDAIASYRRSQFLAAGSTIVSASDSEDAEIRPTLHAEHLDLRPHHPLHHRPSFDELLWDDLDIPSHNDPLPRRSLPLPRRTQMITQTTRTLNVRTPRIHERTPLLRKTISFHDAPHPRHSSFQKPDDNLSTALPPDLIPFQSTGQPQNTLSSTDSVGKSTFGQTLFNSIAILLGIGMLAEPLAFAYAGWVGGTMLILSYGFIACYTAKILARIMLADPRLHSYADIGLKAFGPRSTLLTSFLFCLELSAVSVVLVTLYADSLHTVAPAYSANTYKLLGLIVLIPTVFLPLSLLSYASILGIISTLLIIFVVLVDGFSKPDGPGSLWSPAETSIWADNAPHLGIAFGLFMAGFSGHAVIPSLARDMVDPQEFDKMINWAFVIATFIYTLIGYAGYLMFGNSVSDEVSVDLLNTPGYNPLLNQAALWMLVISPLTKFALTTRPINVVLEAKLQSSLQKTISTHNEASPKESKHVAQFILIVIERVSFTLVAVGVSILVPDFSSSMAFLGSFSAFVICVIGPIAAKIALTERCGLFDAFALVVASIMAIWGTAAAFWTT